MAEFFDTAKLIRFNFRVKKRIQEFENTMTIQQTLAKRVFFFNGNKTIQPTLPAQNLGIILFISARDGVHNFTFIPSQRQLCERKNVQK